jgi:predicted PurR-regulated permease PerM
MVTEGTLPEKSTPREGSDSSALPPLTYWVKVAAVVVAVIAVARAIGMLGNVILIFVAAYVISLGLQPLLSNLERRGLRRGAGMAVIILAGLVLAAGLGAVIVPTIAGQVTTAVDSLPDLIDRISEMWPFVGDLIDDIPLAAEVEGEEAVEMIGSFAVGVFNTVTLILLVPYFAVGFPQLKAQALRLLKRDHREDFVYVVNQATELTSNYILGNLVISLVAGVVSYVAFLLIGLPYALALAAWVALTDMIPAVGALIGAVPVLVVALMMGPQEFVWALVFLIVYQQAENYLLAPRVMNRAVDLRPPTVIFAILIGGSLGGVVGALLALPLAAMGKVLLTEFMIRKRVETVRDHTTANGGTRRRRRRGPLGSRPLP